MFTGVREEGRGRQGPSPRGPAAVRASENPHWSHDRLAKPATIHVDAAVQVWPRVRPSRCLIEQSVCELSKCLVCPTGMSLTQPCPHTAPDLCEKDTLSLTVGHGGQRGTRPCQPLLLLWVGVKVPTPMVVAPLPFHLRDSKQARQSYQENLPLPPDQGLLE